LRKERKEGIIFIIVKLYKAEVMVNQKNGSRSGGIASLLFFFPMMILGLKTMAKYRYIENDWHYEVALAGSILTVVMITVALIGVLLTFRFKRA
jgi:hypothetical protein